MIGRKRRGGGGGRKEGKKEGRKEGMKEGRKDGRKKNKETKKVLLAFGRIRTLGILGLPWGIEFLILNV